MLHNLWFYEFINLLPIFRSLENPVVLDEIEIARQLGNEYAATRIQYNDETNIWHLR
jgi:hypothetical protein